MTSFLFLKLRRGVVSGAAAREVDTPGQHLQSCLAGIKTCAVCLWLLLLVMCAANLESCSRCVYSNRLNKANMLKSIELSSCLQWVIYSSKLLEYLLCWWHIWSGRLEHSSWQVKMMLINFSQNQLLLFDIFKSLKLKVKRKVNDFLTLIFPLYKSVMMGTMVV